MNSLTNFKAGFSKLIRERNGIGDYGLHIGYGDFDIVPPSQSQQKFEELEGSEGVSEDGLAQIAIFLYKGCISLIFDTDSTSNYHSIDNTKSKSFSIMNDVITPFGGFSGDINNGPNIKWEDITGFLMFKLTYDSSEVTIDSLIFDEECCVDLIPLTEALFKEAFSEASMETSSKSSFVDSFIDSYKKCDEEYKTYAIDIETNGGMGNLYQVNDEVVKGSNKLFSV